MNTTLPVVSPDGARAELIVSAPNGAQTFVYWCPAMGVTARQYRLFAQALAAAGIGIATHEWRGAGSSDQRASRRNDWGYRELLDDIDAGVVALRAAHDVQRLVIGGHSLGAQLGMLALARNPKLADAVLLIGSGMPWWRTFPIWQQPILFAVFGWFRGRRVGFAGDEARGVIRDWARTGMSGRYRAERIDIDLDAALAALKIPGWATHLSADRFAPMPSMRELQSRLSAVDWTTVSLGADAFDSRQATHFSWMKEPGPIVNELQRWLL
jgi:predicted alpha/beta hydrolase